MSDYKILSKETISNAEVLDLLEKRKSERELTYREEKSLDYLKKVVNVSPEDAVKIKKELLDLNLPRLEESHYVKIIEIMPKNGTQLRGILANTGAILVDENVTKIIDILNKYQ